MGDLKAIKILHDIKSRKLYNLVSEFFRLSGLYIGEGIIKEYTKEEYYSDCDCFQVFICISRQKPLEPLVLIDSERYIYIDASEKRDSKDILEALMGDICRMSNEEMFYASENVLRGLIFPYLEFGLCKASCDLQYYRLKADIHKGSEKAFAGALKFLQDEMGENGTECWLEYAKLYCKQKINLACYYQENRALEYPVEGLANECKEMISRYPQFSNGKVLLGMIYENSHNNIKDAIWAYREALESEGKKCYSAHIYYWIGKLYENYGSRHDDAKYAYQNAYLYKKKYRNIFKMATMARVEKDFQKELQYYEECIRVLEERKDVFMDPLEMEYYFKTCLVASFSCMNENRNLDAAVQHAKNAERFYNRDINETTVFEELYGEEAEQYRELTKSRMNQKIVYQYLAIAHRELGKKEESDNYWLLSEKMRS